MFNTIRCGLLAVLATTALSAADEAAGSAIDPSTLQFFTPYPLAKCLVSGDAIGEMGPGISTVYKGQEITFCCKPCVRMFAKKPDHFLAELKKAVMAQGETMKHDAPEAPPAKDAHSGHH